jgi:hypothetical protein
LISRGLRTRHPRRQQRGREAQRLRRNRMLAKKGQTLRKGSQPEKAQVLLLDRKT